MYVCVFANNFRIDWIFWWICSELVAFLPSLHSHLSMYKWCSVDSQFRFERPFISKILFKVIMLKVSASNDRYTKSFERRLQSIENSGTFYACRFRMHVDTNTYTHKGFYSHTWYSIYFKSISQQLPHENPHKEKCKIDKQIPKETENKNRFVYSSIFQCEYTIPNDLKESISN